MVTLGELVRAPQRIGEVGDGDVLIAADGSGELLVHEGKKKREATMVFMHETIQMMKAERAEEIAKLSELVSDSSLVVPLVRKASSFWDHVTLGRSASADIVIDDPAISGVHANFVEPRGQLPMSLIDVGSSNGTFLNRVPLQPHAAVRLSAGDCVRFGQTVFYFATHSALRDLLEYRGAK